MLRRFLILVVRFLFKTLTRMEVHGLENVPPQGQSCLAAINHVSRLDAAILVAFMPRHDVTGLISTKYQRNPFFRWMIEKGGGLWINREELDLTALRTARAYMQKGGALGIAPEGTRSPNASLIEPKTGVAYLAEKAGAPILPVGITGTEHAVSSLLRLRRARVTIRYGKPFTLPPLERSDRSGALERNTDRIMLEIARLLPPEYRGIYAGRVEEEDPRAPIP
jgi:1-acyl-sn-glycerol-3-phosphate acyltransferase